LPNRQPDRAAAVLFGEAGERAHLLDGKPADRHGDADVEQSVLALRMNSEMSALRARLARDATFKREALRLEGKMLLGFRHEGIDAHAVEHVFEPRLLAIGAIAMIDEDANERERDRCALLRPQQQPRVAGEIAVAGNAAEQHAEIDSGRNRLTLAHRNRREPDVVRVLEHRDAAAAVERNVELAGQAVEFAMLKDRVVQVATERPRVDQFVGIDARGRAAGDVADVVGAGAARRQAHILNRG
jgi:hypothetical protein